MKSRRTPRTANVEDVVMVSAATVRLSASMQADFKFWLMQQNITVPLVHLMNCPELLGLLLRVYAQVLYSSGVPLGNYKHLLAGLGREKCSLRFSLGEAWEFATRWQTLEPVTHRPPLPIRVYHAMIVLALALGWRRWAGILILAFEGLARIGEPLRATRAHLLLPRDMFAEEPIVFLRIDKPKSRYRGGALVQHCSVRGRTVALLEGIFSDLEPGDPLYNGSPAMFRSRWDKLLRTLQVPLLSGLLPGGARGGGAVAAYQARCPIADIMWSMRIKQATTLEHYLQEVAAINCLGDLTPKARRSIEIASKCFPLFCASFFEPDRSFPSGKLPSRPVRALELPP